MENDIKAGMEKALANLQTKFQQIKVGRASVDMIKSISVEGYGTLNKIATLSTSGAKTLVIEPSDREKASLIEKAIIKSGLGFNPINDGKLIRINIPDLTEDRRKEYLKTVKKDLEDAKVGIRNVRQQHNTLNKSLKDKKQLSEDQLKSKEKEIQKITDQYMEKVEALYKIKEKDIMGK